MKNKEIKSQQKSKLPFLLVILILLLTLSISAFIIGTHGKSDDETSETVEESSTVHTETEISETETTTEETTTTTATETTTTTITESEVPHRDGMVGVSDKKFTDDNSLVFKDSVNGDKTGKWRQAIASMSVFIPEYALDYYNTYFKSNDEIHAFIDISSGKTSCISIVAGMIDVTIHNYVYGEEDDANLLFSGDVLEEYFIYTDNGDIERIR